MTTKKTPAEIDATGDDTVTIEYGGISYTLPASREDAPLEMIEELEADRLTGAVEALLGPEQWAAFKATKPKVRDRGALFDAWVSAIGLGDSGG